MTGRAVRLPLSRSTTLRMWWALIVCFAVAAATLLASVGYTAHSQRRAEQREREVDRRWCELLATVDVPQPTTPPKTPQEARRRRAAAQLHQLRVDIGCLGRSDRLG